MLVGLVIVAALLLLVKLLRNPYDKHETRLPPQERPLDLVGCRERR